MVQKNLFPCHVKIFRVHHNVYEVKQNMYVRYEYLSRKHIKKSVVNKWSIWLL